jgi:hypothetical protein
MGGKVAPGSGKPVISEILFTGTPALASACLVPPVLKSSKPSRAKPLAKSVTPVLSETLMIARIVPPFIFYLTPCPPSWQERGK